MILCVVLEYMNIKALSPSELFLRPKITEGQQTVIINITFEKKWLDMQTS